jgi:hypothetical protein
MGSFHSGLRLSSILIASALGACSSSSALPDKGDAQDDEGQPMDAQFPEDAQPGADAQPVHDAQPIEDVYGPDGGPVGDGGASVWSANSTGFEVTESGGLLAPPPDGSPCTGTSQTWIYNAMSRQITRTGCLSGQPRDATVVLTPSSAAQLVAALSSLKTKGPNTSCGADAPDDVLIVFGAGDAGQQVYRSDFYSAPGCGNGAPGPFIAFDDLGKLIADVDAFFAACSPDGGAGAADAGASCVTGDR